MTMQLRRTTWDQEQHRKKCSDGSTNTAVKGGVCIRHGSKIKRCSSDGCTKHMLREVCVLGMVRVWNDAAAKDVQRLRGEEFARGTELRSKDAVVKDAQKSSQERRSVHETWSISQCTRWIYCIWIKIWEDYCKSDSSSFQSGAIAIGGQEESSVPGEVTILCEEIVEVWIKVLASNDWGED